MEQKAKEIKNITCNARNCAYNDKQRSKCMAGSIQVGTRDACTCSETICATFQLDDNITV